MMDDTLLIHFHLDSSLTTQVMRAGAMVAVQQGVCGFKSAAIGTAALKKYCVVALHGKRCAGDMCRWVGGNSQQ